MNSNILRAVDRCMRATTVQARINREMLDSLVTSDQQGEYIENDVKKIIKCRATLNAPQTAESPSAKAIARANEIIQICTNTIKSRLIQLSATDDEIASSINKLNNADYESFTLDVLKLMARKNPEMHKKKYERALAMVASKQKQH